MIRKKFGPHVFRTEIRDSSRYLDAMTQGTPITFHQPESEEADTYRRLFKEISERIEQNPPPIPPCEQSVPGYLSRTKSLNSARLIPIEDILPDPNQPRTTFNEDRLQDLVVSVRAKGVMQPVIVRSTPEGFRITTGGRRVAAAKLAGIKEIPCIIRDTTDEEALILQVVENLQRENLTPVEEANAIKRLLNSGLTQEEVSKQIGKSQSYVSQSQKLLTLPKSILEEAKAAKISKDQLLQLTKAENPEGLWQQIRDGKTAREIRTEVHKGRTSKGRPKNFSYAFSPQQKPYRVLVQFNRPNVEKDEIEEALREALANVEKPCSQTQT